MSGGRWDVGLIGAIGLISLDDSMCARALCPPPWWFSGWLGGRVGIQRRGLRAGLRAGRCPPQGLQESRSAGGYPPQGLRAGLLRGVYGGIRPIHLLDLLHLLPALS